MATTETIGGAIPPPATLMRRAGTQRQLYQRSARLPAAQAQTERPVRHTELVLGEVPRFGHLTKWRQEWQPRGPAATERAVLMTTQGWVEGGALARARKPPPAAKTRRTRSPRGPAPSRGSTLPSRRRMIREILAPRAPAPEPPKPISKYYDPRARVAPRPPSWVGAGRMPTETEETVNCHVSQQFNLTQDLKSTQELKVRAMETQNSLASNDFKSTMELQTAHELEEEFLRSTQELPEIHNFQESFNAETWSRLTGGTPLDSSQAAVDAKLSEFKRDHKSNGLHNDVTGLMVPIVPVPANASADGSPRKEESGLASIPSPRFRSSNRNLRPPSVSSGGAASPGAQPARSWSQAEDRILSEGVGFFCQGESAFRPHLANNWHAVAVHLKSNRTPDECRERWLEIRSGAALHHLRVAVDDAHGAQKEGAGAATRQIMKRRLEAAITAGQAIFGLNPGSKPRGARNRSASEDEAYQLHRYLVEVANKLVVDIELQHHEVLARRETTAAAARALHHGDGEPFSEWAEGAREDLEDWVEWLRKELPLTEERVTEILGAADLDHDGWITLAEFTRAVCEARKANLAGDLAEHIADGLSMVFLAAGRSDDNQVAISALVNCVWSTDNNVVELVRTATLARDQVATGKTGGLQGLMLYSQQQKEIAAAAAAARPKRIEGGIDEYKKIISLLKKDQNVREDRINKFHKKSKKNKTGGAKTVDHDADDNTTTDTHSEDSNTNPLGDVLEHFSEILLHSEQVARSPKIKGYSTGNGHYGDTIRGMDPEEVSKVGSTDADSEEAEEVQEVEEEEEEEEEEESGGVSEARSEVAVLDEVSAAVDTDAELAREVEEDPQVAPEEEHEQEEEEEGEEDPHILARPLSQVERLAVVSAAQACLHAARPVATLVKPETEGEGPLSFNLDPSLHRLLGRAGLLSETEVIRALQDSGFEDLEAIKLASAEHLTKAGINIGNVLKLLSNLTEPPPTAFMQSAQANRALHNAAQKGFFTATYTGTGPLGLHIGPWPLINALEPDCLVSWFPSGQLKLPGAECGGQQSAGIQVGMELVAINGVVVTSLTQEGGYNMFAHAGRPITLTLRTPLRQSEVAEWEERLRSMNDDEWDTYEDTDQIEQDEATDTVTQLPTKHDDLQTGVAIDTTGDGKLNAIGYDTNGDGTLNAVDSNMDGELDAWDTTGDGKLDAWDTTHDGRANAYDLTGDGKIDALDTTGDGKIDISKTHQRVVWKFSVGTRVRYSHYRNAVVVRQSVMADPADQQQLHKNGDSVLKRRVLPAYTIRVPAEPPIESVRETLIVAEEGLVLPNLPDLDTKDKDTDVSTVDQNEAAIKIQSGWRGQVDRAKVRLEREDQEQIRLWAVRQEAAVAAQAAAKAKLQMPPPSLRQQQHVKDMLTPERERELNGAAVLIQKTQRGKAAREVTRRKELASSIFKRVMAFDDNHNGFIDKDEFKAYLKSIGQWQISDPNQQILEDTSESALDLYTDENWEHAWPAVCDLLDVKDSVIGMPIDSFVKYTELYRRGELMRDLAKLSALDTVEMAELTVKESRREKLALMQSGNPEEEYNPETVERLSKQIFTKIMAYDANHDGFVDADEFKQYLQAIGAWNNGDELYSDGGWDDSWPAICEMLGVADAEKGIPMQSFLIFTSKYRKAQLAEDLAKLGGNDDPSEEPLEKPSPAPNVDQTTELGTEREVAAATKIQAFYRGDEARKIRRKKVSAAIFRRIMSFDANHDGFIDGNEFKAYLKAVGEWDNGTEELYNDEDWAEGWPLVCELLGAADPKRGIPMESFVKYTEMYRREQVDRDLKALDSIDSSTMQELNLSPDELQERRYQQEEAQVREKAASIFQQILSFDTNHDGFVDAMEFKAYLKAVGEWDSGDPLYADETWEFSWPAICRLLGAEDHARGIPMDAFIQYAEKYRRAHMDDDLAKLQSMDGTKMAMLSGKIEANTSTSTFADEEAAEEARKEAATRIQAIHRGKAQRLKAARMGNRRNVDMKVGKVKQPHRGSSRYLGHEAVGSATLS